MKRRKFINALSLTSAGIFLSQNLFAKKELQKKENVISAKDEVKPIIISTWNHGLEANRVAWKVMQKGGSSLDAVEQGVRQTEADPTNRSVGLGGLPDSEGNVTLDACIMNSKSQCGSVAYLQEIEHPISVARKVMENTPHVMLVGKGAQEFALSQGFEKKNLLTPEAKMEWLDWKRDQMKKPRINSENHDTIGMLAIDKDGNISGACTTSGWAYKLPGRVGDSPIIGAGLFVDGDIGAACATGMGEAVIRIAGSHTVVELMRQGHSPEEACRLAVERIRKKHSDLKDLQVGFIALNRAGKVGGYSLYGGFNYALKDAENEKLVDTKYDLDW